MELYFCSLYMAAWRLQEQLYVYIPLDFISCRFEVSKCFVEGKSIMGYYALYIHIQLPTFGGASFLHI